MEEAAGPCNTQIPIPVLIRVKGINEPDNSFDSQAEQNIPDIDQIETFPASLITDERSNNEIVQQKAPTKALLVTNERNHTLQWVARITTVVAIFIILVIFLTVSLSGDLVAVFLARILVITLAMFPWFIILSVESITKRQERRLNNH